MEILWGPWMESFTDMADAAGWTPAQRFPMTLLCLGGVAKDKYRELINDPPGNYMPANNANRTPNCWWESMRGLSTKVATSNIMWLGNEVN